ncbi:MAG: hypothetical protein AB1488_03160 [Nitrospirota bacterium]
MEVLNEADTRAKLIDPRLQREELLKLYDETEKELEEMKPVCVSAQADR